MALLEVRSEGSTDAWQVTSVNLIAAVALAAPFPVAAQAPVTPSPRPELHRQFLLMALDSYQRARCEGNQPCAPASTSLGEG
jgi:hypothetical protein